MRISTLVVVACACVLAGALLGRGTRSPRAQAPDATVASAGPRVPVVVELFTSEGCSSCPPADTVLSWLVEQQPVPGAQVIALGEHVDYWDYLGWRDPFSSASLTDRQRGFARDAFHTGEIYTPQLVVAGRYQAIGSDRDAVVDAIRKAATEAPARTLAITATPREGRLFVRVPAGEIGAGAPLDVVVALTEDGLSSQVVAGENEGRRLAHVRVARTLVAVPKGASAGDVDVPVTIDPKWARPRLTVVAFLQDRVTRAIVAATSAPLRDLAP